MIKQEKNVHKNNRVLNLVLRTFACTSLLMPLVLGAAEGRLELQTVEVTGSRIPRADTESMAPLAIFDREDIERSGVTTINEFFRKSVVSSAGIIDEKFTQGFAPGAAGIDLRGLGVNRTLVLLDGRRLPIYPTGQEGTQSFVDINSIPLAAIERIEVLKDGASAIYGADAVAGVVNIITRKDQEGFEGTAQYGMADEGDGEEARLSAITGKRWENTSVTLVVDYFDRKDIMAKDRDFSRSAKGPIDDRSPASNPGTWFVPFPVAADNCPPGRIAPLGGPMSLCLYDFAPWVTLVPETERLGLLSNLEHEFGNGLRLFARAMYNYSESEHSLAPAGSSANTLFSVSSVNPTNPLNPPEDLQVAYRFEELGPRRDEYKTNAYNLLAGIGGYVGSWDWEAALGYGRVDTETRGINGYAAIADLQAAVDAGTLNLFGPSPTFDADSVAYKTKRDGYSKLYYADAKATGELYRLPAGPLQLAVGGEVRKEKFRDKFDELTETGAILAIGGVSAKGDRNIQSAYAELSVPATDDLELQLAGRFDHYSDFGNTYNPKVGLRWQPLSNLMLRASAGTGFKAPALHELYSGEILGFESLIDDGTPVNNVPITITGNPDLDAENSRSVNLGFVWDVTPQWDVSIDGWYIKNKDAVNNDPQYILDNEARFPGLVERDGLGNLVSIESPFQNITAQKLWGIDLETHVDWATKQVGDFRFGIMASYLGSFKEEIVEGEGFEDLAGEDGRPRVRSQGTIGWNRSVYDGALTINYISGYDRSDVNDSIGSWTTVDAQLNWSPRAIKGGTLTLGAENLFDNAPPKDPFFERWPFINRALHDPRGRFIYLRYKHEF